MLRRWDGSTLMAGGTIRRWTGERWEPDLHFAPMVTYNGTGSSVAADLSATNAVTLLFEAVLWPVDGGVHMAIEHHADSTVNGFFLLTESEFGHPNVLEFDSNLHGTHDIVTVPRPTSGVTHRYAWVMDRTKLPCHAIYVDGAGLPVTAEPGYSTSMGGANFAVDTLFFGARNLTQLPAHVSLSTPPQVLPYAMSPADALAVTA